MRRRGNLIKKFAILMLLSLCASPSFAATLVSAPPSQDSFESRDDYEQAISIILEDSLVDHKAIAHGVTGHVEIYKSDGTDWLPLKAGDAISEGDQIRTSQNAYVELSYDEYHLNYIRIDQNSTVEFKTLEPTHVFVEEGTVFNNLDGLVTGTEYEVSTPASVAAVRGTSFTRSFDPTNMTDDTSVVEGLVDVAPVIDDHGTVDFSQAFQVTQNQQLAFDREALRSRNFQHIRPRPMEAKRKDRLSKIHKQSLKRRAEFAGGGDRPSQLKQRFSKMKRNPEKMRRMQNQMRKRNLNSPNAHKLHNSQRNKQLRVHKGNQVKRANRLRGPQQTVHKPQAQRRQGVGNLRKANTKMRNQANVRHNPRQQLQNQSNVNRRKAIANRPRKR